MTKTAILSLVLTFLTAPLFAQTQSVSASSIACIQSMCGPKSTFVHPFVKDPSLALQSFTKFKNDEYKVKRPIELYMGRLINRTLLQDKAFQYLLAQTESFNVSAKSQALILTFVYLKRFNEYAPALRPTSTGLAFDQTELQKILPDADANEIAAIMSLSDILKSNRIAGLESKPLEMILKRLHYDKTTTEAQVIEAQRIIKAREALKTYLGSLSDFSEEDIIVLKASRGEPLTYLEKNHFKNEIKSSSSIEFVISGPVQQKFMMLPFDTLKIISNFKDIYDNSQQKNLVKNPKTSKVLFESNYAKCISNISYAYQALPNTAQLESFKTNAELVMAISKQMIEEKYKLSINDLGIQTAYPDTRDNMVSSLINGFDVLTKSADKSFKLLKSAKLDDPKNLEFLLVLAASFSDTNIFENLQNYCDVANVPTLNDSALPYFKILNLSWPTIQYPEIGLSIFAHEIGHIISYQYGASEKACLSQKQNNSTLYQEEDFADLFAAEVASRLKFKAGSTQLGNLSCGLLPYDDNADWRATTLENPDASDPHSSGLFRLLAYGAMTTGLTQQCQSHLNLLNQNTFNDYCKWDITNPK